MPPCSTHRPHRAYIVLGRGLSPRVNLCHRVHRLSRFDRALGMMHHMMYEQARSAFEAIAEADPQCAMAHWGIATTLFQPLWPQRPSEEVLKRGFSADSKSQGAEAGYRKGSPVWWKRPRAFSANRKPRGTGTGSTAGPKGWPWPTRPIPTTWIRPRYTLFQGFRWRLEVEDSDPLHDEAEAVLRKVWEKEPTHPGAIHYSIHATDVEGRAENALDLVEAYGKIAPEVPHALHMPSHIYVRLGNWPEVIDWNRRSADAALRKPVNGAVSLHYIHAMDYLLYAYLQKVNDDEARGVFEEAMGKDNHQAAYVSAFHLAAMPARLAVERRDWQEATVLAPRTPRLPTLGRRPLAGRPDLVRARTRRRAYR
jgi:hypothetical protein